MAKNTTAIGLRAEDVAATYLESVDYRVVARNDRTRFAELDLIVANRDSIVFVEVKYRKSTDFGGGAAAITADKLRRLRNATEVWLAEHQEYTGFQPRIDAVFVQGSIESPTVEHIENITD